MRHTFWLLATLLVVSTPPFEVAAQHQYGSVHFETSCSAETDEEFATAVALLHHMMYEQSEEHFRNVAAADPSCAMAHWGIAMTQLHPLWAPPTDAELKKGQEASATAREIGAPTDREKGYIDAIHAFFHTDGGFPERLQAWEDAQKELHESHPDDVDAAAFYALAHLATAPKDDQTYAQQREAGRLLENLLEKAPEHPGLFHYTIHAYDNPPLADQAVEVARSYDKLAPEVPHALHMPSHIFVRLGLWEDVVSWNIRSADAALKHSSEGVTSMHYPHAMDYLIYARLQQARDSDVRAAIEEMLEHENFQPHVGSAYALAAGPARLALERRDWEEAAQLAVRNPPSFPWERFPAAESITWFAKGLGAARLGDEAAARSAIERLNELYDALIAAEETYWAVHTDAQRTAIDAWLTYQDGQVDAALEQMTKAADLEDSVDKHPVTPSAVLPARELLGEMYLLADRPGEALEAFEESLAISANRLNSLTGAGRAAELMGDDEKAAAYYSDAMSQVDASPEAARPRLTEARGFGGSR